MLDRDLNGPLRLDAWNSPSVNSRVSFAGEFGVELDVEDDGGHDFGEDEATPDPASESVEEKAAASGDETVEAAEFVTLKELLALNEWAGALARRSTPRALRESVFDIGDTFAGMWKDVLHSLPDVHLFAVCVETLAGLSAPGTFFFAVGMDTLAGM